MASASLRSLRSLSLVWRERPDWGALLSSQQSSLDHPENLTALRALGRHTSCRTSRRTAAAHLNDGGMQVAPQADIRYTMARSQAAIAVPGFRLPHILKANEGEEPTMACSSPVCITDKA